MLRILVKKPRVQSRELIAQSYFSTNSHTLYYNTFKMTTNNDITHFKTNNDSVYIKLEK